MIKKIFLLSLIALSLFANNKNMNKNAKNYDDIDKLLDKLQEFQQKLVSKNATLANSKEIKKMQKQINLLREKFQYLSINKQFLALEEQTKDNLKKIISNLYYLAVRVYKKPLIIYLPYKMLVVLNNEKFVVVDKGNFYQVLNEYIKRKKEFETIKNNYFNAIDKKTFLSYSNAIDNLSRFILNVKNSELMNDVLFSDNDKYLNLKELQKKCNVEIDNNLKLLVFKGCNL